MNMFYDLQINIRSNKNNAVFSMFDSTYHYQTTYLKLSKLE